MNEKRLSDDAEMDVMAYADGLLDDDPARKAMVEARLRESPREREHVETLRSLNAELRRRYDGRLAEPVPERLYDALETDGPEWRRIAVKVASVVVLVGTATAAGWWVGKSDSTLDWPPRGFLNENLMAELALGSDGTPAVAGSGRPLNWLSERVSFSLRMPDLSAQGYTVAHKETVHVADQRMVRIVYQKPGGERLALLLHPWWDKPSPKIDIVRRNGVWLAYWRDGPLATALASRRSRDEVLSLAREVRAAMHDKNRASPKVRPQPRTPNLPGIADERTPTLPLPIESPQMQGRAGRR